MTEETRMRIAFYGDSLVKGNPGVAFLDVLQPMLSRHAFVNLGKGGDTVISLSRRIEKSEQTPSDLAVLWVGVNDVLSMLSLGHSALKWVTRQPRARDLVEFRAYYHRILSRLRRSSDNILAISPLLIGEELSNPWNRKLEELARIAHSAAASFDHTYYLDLRARLAAVPAMREASDYLPRSITRILLDSLFLQGSAGIDRAATRRGLHLTLDGVHLNSRGAQEVATLLRAEIEAFS